MLRFICLWLAAANLMLPVETLDGKARAVPGDIAKPAVLVVTFDRAATDEGAEWSARLRETVPAAGVYQVAILEDVPSFVRGFVIGQMKRSVPSSMHSNFLIATKRSDEWKRFAGYAYGAVPYVLVIGRDGEMRVRDHGKFDRSKLAAIREAWQSAP